MPKQAHGCGKYRGFEAGEGWAQGRGCSRSKVCPSTPTYVWKAKYGGMDVSEVEEVKNLRDENERLKKPVADLSLDEDMMQSV